MCRGKISGFETQSDKSSAQERKSVYIFLIILKEQIINTVLKDGISNPGGFPQLSLRSRILWHRYENVINYIFIEEKIWFQKNQGLKFKPNICGFQVFML